MCSTSLFVIVACCLLLQLTRGNPTDIEIEVVKSDQKFTSYCASQRTQINPDDLIRKWLPDENWEFDVNFSQRIEGEVCEKEGLSCNDFPLMKTRCVQRYLNIQLQVVSKDKKSELKSFPIPSYCECAYFRRRIGDNSKSSDHE